MQFDLEFDIQLNILSEFVKNRHSYTTDSLQENNYLKKQICIKPGAHKNTIKKTV